MVFFPDIIGASGGARSCVLFRAPLGISLEITFNHFYSMVTFLVMCDLVDFIIRAGIKSQNETSTPQPVRLSVSIQITRIKRIQIVMSNIIDSIGLFKFNILTQYQSDAHCDVPHWFVSCLDV